MSMVLSRSLHVQCLHELEAVQMICRHYNHHTWNILLCYAWGLARIKQLFACNALPTLKVQTLLAQWYMYVRSF